MSASAAARLRRPALIGLGLAAAYASWRRGRMATGGAWLGVTAALAKPHLGLGLAALMIARRDRRLLAGAAAGVAAVAAACIVVAGPSGCAGFMRIAVGSAGRWNLASMLGFTGLFGSWLGDGGMTHAVAALATVVAVAACAALGSAWRHSPRQLEAALAGATALSLVASPHLLGHDLTLLSPAAAWCLGAATGVDGAAVRWPGRAARRVLALWALVNLAAAADLGNGHGAPPGRLVPIALVAIGAAAWTACRPRLRRARARRLGTSYAGRGSGVGGVVE